MNSRAVEAFSLEPRSIAHAEALFEVLADPGLYDFIEEAPPATVEALRQKLARSESRKSPDGSEHWLNWIVRTASGEVAGYVQTTIADDGRTWVAYMLGAAYQGRGLASSAVARMMDQVAEDYGVRCFQVVITRANRRSIAVAERVGFSAVIDQAACGRTIASDDVLMMRLVS